MKKIFINKNEQIRSGWKIALIFLAVFGFQLFISCIIGLAFGIMSVYTKIEYQKIISLLSECMKYMTPVLTIIIVWLFFKFMDKKKLSESGFTNKNKGIKNLFVGLLLGAISMTAIFSILILTSNAAVKGSLLKPEYSSNLWSGLILFIFVGFEEEYLFRGYVMNVLSQTGNKWVVCIVSAIIFSLSHGLNPNVSAMGLANIFFVGLLFAYMLFKTGSLWMSVGYHITWNYFQGNIFGFPVSGTKPEGIYTIINVKDNLLTGGGFGPEGGLIVTAAILLCGLFVYAYSKVKNDRGLNIQKVKK